jgi:DNA-binding transcriptional regulator/RsmH inhibitor MraZ
MGTIMGEVIELDDRGRLTIPSDLRQILRGPRVVVERGEDNTILIRPEFDSEAVLKNIRAIRLRGERRRAKYDAAIAKDRYGGVKG